MNAAVPAFAELLELHGSGSDKRKAALFLSLVGQADREWLMQRLDVSHRLEVQSLLEELKPLDLPLQATDARAMLGDRQATMVRRSAAGSFQRFDTATVADVLRREPPSLLALLWRVEHPACTQEVLESLGLAKAGAVRALLQRQDLHVPERLLREVVARFESALASSVAENRAQPKAAVHGLGHRLMQGLHRRISPGTRRSGDAA